MNHHPIQETESHRQLTTESGDDQMKAGSTGDAPEAAQQAGTRLSTSRDGLAFVVRYRRYADPRQVEIQLLAQATDFYELRVPDGFFLEAIDLLAPDWDGLSNVGCRRVACVMIRTPDEQSALSHLIVTAPGSLHPVPAAAASDVYAVNDWRMFYSHEGVVSSQ